MPKVTRQIGDMLHTAGTRQEIARAVAGNGFEGMLDEVGGFTSARFAEALRRDGGVVPVVIPAHNEGGLQSDLPATLLSIARSEAYPIVVNNRSEDDTVQIAKRMGATVIDAPLGRKMAATKVGIDYVRNELGTDRMLFTDADTLVVSQWAGSMSMRLANVTSDEGAALFGGSIKWHGPSMATDAIMSSKAYAADYYRRRAGKSPTAHGHNYGLQFDAAGAMQASIDALPSDLFVDQGQADDAMIAASVAEAGATIMGPEGLDQYVLTRGDRVTSLRDAVSLMLHRTTYNEVAMPSYRAEYPDFY